MTAAAFEQYVQLQARLRLEVKANAQRLQTRALVEAGENAAAWVAIEALTDTPASNRLLRLVLPSSPRRRTRLPAGRRKNYEEHLQRVIAEAHSTVSLNTSPVPSNEDCGTPVTLAGHLCALCSGGCCLRGGDTAYLSATTLRRFMAQHPQLLPAEVLSAYLERLKTRTEAGSCINHTARGCGLPRNMRSDTCNLYACDSLSELRAGQAAVQPVMAVIAIRRRQDQWTRGKLLLDNDITGLALITDAGIATLPLKPPAASTDSVPAEGA